jgi:hypothetical protein
LCGAVGIALELSVVPIACPSFCRLLRLQWRCLTTSSGDNVSNAALGGTAALGVADEPGRHLYEWWRQIDIGAAFMTAACAWVICRDRVARCFDQSGSSLAGKRNEREKLRKLLNREQLVDGQRFQLTAGCSTSDLAVSVACWRPCRIAFVMSVRGSWAISSKPG